MASSKEMSETFVRRNDKYSLLHLQCLTNLIWAKILFLFDTLIFNLEITVSIVHFIEQNLYCEPFFSFEISIQIPVPQSTSILMVKKIQNSLWVCTIAACSCQNDKCFK